MKKLLALLLLSSLLLVGCTYQPETPVTPQTGESSEADETSVLCLVATDGSAVSPYFEIGTNCLKVRKTGDAEIVDDKKGGRTLSVGDNSYPVYYSVTTRPAGELNEVDAYVDSDGVITTNYLKDTDQIYVLAFGDYFMGPMVGGISEELLTAFALKNLPSDFNLDQYRKVYEGDENFGAQLVLIRQITEFDTIERITVLVSPEGHLMEMRLENYGQMKAAELEYALASREVLEAAVSAQIRNTYKDPDGAAIETITFSAITLGKDISGEAYYNVTADVTYSGTTAAPTKLQLLYFPERLV